MQSFFHIFKKCGIFTDKNTIFIFTNQKKYVKIV